jgi:CRISPR-associated protein Cas1
MHDQDTESDADQAHCCRHCRASLDGRPRTQRFCSRSCYQQWWVTNRQREVAACGTQKLAALQAAGHDPRSVGETARQRSAKIAESNRRTPRRRKREGEPPAEPPAAPTLTVLPLPIPATEPIGDDDDADDVAWAERGEYWLGRAEPPVPRQRRRDKRAEPTPLVLTGHGVRLQVDHGALLVRDGFTHHPQQRRERRLFPGDPTLPSRIVVLDGNGTLSLDVVAWLAQQALPLVLLDWQGQVVSVLSGSGGAPDPGLREAQLAARVDGQGLQLATWLIARKIEGSIKTTRALPPSPARDRTLHKLHQTRDELARWPPADIETLRLIEGRAALAYFTGWEAIPLRWKGTGRRPIPPDWHHAGLRQSFVSGTNRHATHPVNAMLNYAYGVLESQVRIATVAAGLDPTMGYLHACRPGRVALVYDLMEPLRPQVDRLVLGFVQGRSIDPRDFILSERGVCRLHPQLARAVAGLGVFNVTVEEAVAMAVRKLTAVHEPGPYWVRR